MLIFFIVMTKSLQSFWFIRRERQLSFLAIRDGPSSDRCLLVNLHARVVRCPDPPHGAVSSRAFHQRSARPYIGTAGMSSTRAFKISHRKRNNLVKATRLFPNVLVTASTVVFPIARSALQVGTGVPLANQNSKGDLGRDQIFEGLSRAFLMAAITAAHFPANGRLVAPGIHSPRWLRSLTLGPFDLRIQSAKLRRAHPNHLRLSWDDPPSIWDGQNIGNSWDPLSMAFSSIGTVNAIVEVDLSLRLIRKNQRFP